MSTASLQMGGGERRRLAAAVGAALAVALTPSAATATWRAAQAPGVPFDVEFFDASQFVVTTGTGFSAFVADAPTHVTVTTGVVVGAGFLAPGCVLQILADATTAVTRTDPGATCNFPTDPFAFAGTAYRARSPGGGRDRYAFAAPSTANLATLYHSQGGHQGFGTTGTGVSVRPPYAMDARYAGTVPFGIFSRTVEEVSVFRGPNLLVDRAFPRGGAAFDAANRDLVLLHDTATPGALLLRSTGELDRVADVTALTAPVDRVTLPGLFGSLDYDATSGGYGAAVSLDGATVYRSVPIPGSRGAHWTTTPVTPALPTGARLIRVKCFRAEVCVALTDQGTGNNVFILRNLSAPVFATAAPRVLDENGSVPVDVQAVASDADGDPLYFTLDAAGAPFTIASTGNNGQATLTSNAPRGRICGTETFPLRVTATDGARGGAGSIPITLRQTLAPDPPQLTPGSQTVRSLLGMASLTAARGPGGCAPVSYAWLLVGATGDAAVDLRPLGNGATLEVRPRLAGGCRGMSGTVSLRATATDTVATSPPSGVVTVAIDAAGLAPRPGTVTSGEAVAVCGEGARATVEVAPAEGSCPTATFRCAAGTGIECTVEGGVIQVRSQARGLEELVGTELEVTLIAETEGVVSAPVTHRVLVRAEPFVTVSHRADAPLVEQTGQLGMAARFENQTECPVRSTTLRQELRGMTYVPGSARLDGEPVPVRIVEGALELDGVELGVRAPRELTWLARPTLHGEPTPAAVVSMRGVPVSATTGGISAPPYPGCGCAHGGGPFPAGLLLAVAGWLGARRARCRS